jgi:transglutaminase-like putative cysteine protease
VDIGTRSLVALDRALTRPYDSRAIVYRVTVRDEDDPASVLSRDEHQEVRNVRGSSFELHVRPVRSGEKGDAKPELVHLAPSHFIDHEDDRVAELTRKAVGGEADPWKKALRIERYVRNAMRNDNEAPLAPASAAARSLRGDCRHHAFLTAAMGRSAGLPSRTAIGLLYVYRGGPKFGFHMWAEVLIDGRWRGLDSTLGKGGVSAAHVKVTDHAWYDTASLAPLIPVSRALGKLRFEVLKAE